MNNSELKIFNYKNNEVRTTIQDGEVWWVLKDVCKILGLNDVHKVALRLEKDERNQIPVTDNLGRSQSTTLVNEPGLYKVILRSDKPEQKIYALVFS